MDSIFKSMPLSDEELELIESKQLIRKVKPLYAPAIIKSFLRGNPCRIFTADMVSKKTEVELPQTRVILMRLVKDGWLTRCIQRWGQRTHYYYFEDDSVTGKHTTK